MASTVARSEEAAAAPDGTSARGQAASFYSYVSRAFMNSTCLILGDYVALSFTLYLAGEIRRWVAGERLVPEWAWLTLPIWTLGAVLAKVLPGWGMSAVEHYRRVTLLLLASFGIASAALFLTKTGGTASRLTLTSALLLSLVLVPLVRVKVKRFLLERGLWDVPTVIYGSDETAAHVLEALDAEPGLGYVPVGVFDDQSEPGTLVHGVPVLGRMDQNAMDAPYAIISTAALDRNRFIDLLEGPLTVYRRVIMIPDLLDAPSLWVTARDFVGLVGLEIAVNLLNPVARVAKRIADLLMVLVTLPLWGPVTLVIALLIKLEDRGDVLFVQERIGYYGDRFDTLKFRTMRPDAEAALHRAFVENPDLQAQWEKDCKLRDDPRVTRIGRWLRRTSLDELPQLINVLKGEMSLVGPRPLPEYHHEQLSTQVRNLRDRVRPGLTGLWQVSGRSEAGTRGMERWDAYYVRNWSVWLDTVILVRTIRVVCSAKGAY
jgi:Undecaprenyl-phosphate galactose phosphotransferase WbaP